MAPTRARPVPPQSEASQQETQPPGHQGTDADQAYHNRTDGIQFAELQGQPTFKHDQPDTEGYQGHEEVSDQGIRIHPSVIGERAHDKTHDQQQENGRQAQARGQPLRANPKKEDKSDLC